MNVNLDFLSKDTVWREPFQSKHMFYQNAGFERYAFISRVGEEILFAIYSSGKYRELCILSGEEADKKLRSRRLWPKEE